MSTLEDVKDLFGQLTTTFPTILGQPTDDDVKRLREMLTDLLQLIDIAGGTDRLSGLIDVAADYQAIHGHPFDALLLAMARYDPSIAANATEAVRVKAEREWPAKADLQRLICAAERHGRTFLTTVVEDTWLLSLKSPTTFYNMVSPQDMLQHLATSTAGLEATDIVSLFVDMQSWWEEDPRVPKYINRLEDAQKKASRSRAALPITNEWLAATATKSLLAAGSFPIQRPVWNANLPATKTWPAWMQWARESQIAAHRRAQAACLWRPRRHLRLCFGRHRLPSFEEQFANGLDALALAATNEKAVLDNLVSSNKVLSELTAKKLATIEQLLISKSAAPGAAPSTADTKLVAQLRAAFKGKWVTGGFCSTHGYGVSADHDSSTCKNKKPGHVDTASRSSPAGPGHDKHINKGWDAFLSGSANK
jgi:hypothetical protein